MNFNSLFSKQESTGIFIPSGNGFKELTDCVQDTSLNGYTKHLGYHPDQVNLYFGDFDSDYDIHQIAMEIFSQNIVFIYTKTSVSKVDTKKLEYFLRNFDTWREFDSIKTRDILQSGIQNKSLKIEYLTRLLDLSVSEENGGIFYVPKLGLYLYFSEGILVDFQSSDGLNEWAKYVRELNVDLFNSYVTVAQKYWHDNHKMVENEVNMQGQSLANAPHALRNEFTNKHRAENGTINFSMLLVCHYGHEINEAQFVEINYGRYHFVGAESDGSKKYKYNDFTFTFSRTGELLGME